MADVSATAGVVVDDVSLVYARQDAPPVQALDGISLEVRAGEFVAVVGPSGCGKTSLLKILGGVLDPTKGEVLINGVTSTEALRQHRVAMVFQEANLLPWRTVRGNITLPDELHSTMGDRRKVDELLLLMGLDGFSERYPSEISGGMKQKVGIARALNCDADVLLMDEPFGQIDELTRMKLNDELQRIWMSAGITAVFVTHSIPEAVYLADRVVVLSPRPAHVKAVIPIPFTRPRSISLRQEIGFFTLTKQVLALLTTENGR